MYGKDKFPQQCSYLMGWREAWLFLFFFFFLYTSLLGWDKNLSNSSQQHHGSCNFHNAQREEKGNAKKKGPAGWQQAASPCKLEECGNPRVPTAREGAHLPVDAASSRTGSSAGSPVPVYKSLKTNEFSFTLHSRWLPCCLSGEETEEALNQTPGPRPPWGPWLAFNLNSGIPRSAQVFKHAAELPSRAAPARKRRSDKKLLGSELYLVFLFVSSQEQQSSWK